MINSLVIIIIIIIIINHLYRNGDATFSKYDIVVQGNQHGGMSGGIICNGCTYLGMSYGVSTDIGASFARVVPAKNIARFILANWKRLPNLEDCEGLEVTNLPMMPLMNCDIRYASDEVDQCKI